MYKMRRIQKTNRLMDIFIRSCDRVTIEISLIISYKYRYISINISIVGVFRIDDTLEMVAIIFANVSKRPLSK